MKGIDRLLWFLRRRVLLMVSRAVVALVNDAPRMQTVQVEALRGEVIDGAERIQQYGLTSHPLPGAEAVLLRVGGERQHPIVVAVEDRRYRPTGLQPGDVCLYTDLDDDGNPHRIILRRGRIIEWHAGSTMLKLEPAGMTLTTPSGTQTWGTA